MIATAIVLALAAAVLHGTWNVLAKVSGDPLTTLHRATVVGAVLMTLAVVPAWLVLRPPFSLAATGFALVSATLEMAYLWLLSSAYARGELSVVYPIARGSAPLIAVVVGFGVLGERLAGVQVVGVVLLLAGILAVTLPQTGGKATLPALLTGVAIAAYTSVDRVGVRLEAPWLYAWALVCLIAIEMTVSLAVAERAHYRRPAAASVSWRQGALIGPIMWGGYLLVLLALNIAPLAVVAPIRETAIVAVAVWGVWRLGERQGAWLKIAGAAATLAGVGLLAV